MQTTQFGSMEERSLAEVHYPRRFARFRRGSSPTGYRKILINYASSVGAGWRKRRNLSLWQRVNTKTGLSTGGFDRAICYGPQDMDAEFRENNREILNHKRGAGLWLWKPYVILKTLRQMKNGDYLFYSDVDLLFINSIDPLIQIMKKMNHKIIAFLNRYPGIKAWTKRDAFILMDMDNPRYLDGHMLEAGTILLEKSGKAEKFIEEWLNLCCDRQLLTDSENVMEKPNYPEFQEHRHDQSILSLLYMKHDFAPYRGIISRSYICPVRGYMATPAIDHDRTMMPIHASALYATPLRRMLIILVYKLYYRFRGVRR